MLSIRQRVNTFGNLVAFWKDNRSDVNDIVEKLKEINSLYQVDTFVIEKNGIGQSTVNVAIREGLNVYAFDQSGKDKPYECMLRAKVMIELGNKYQKVKDGCYPISGPEEISEECLNLCLDKHGRGFKGAKDGLMSIGLALWDLETSPHKIETKIDRSQIYVETDWIGNKKEWF